MPADQCLLHGEPCRLDAAAEVLLFHVVLFVMNCFVVLTINIFAM